MRRFASKTVLAGFMATWFLAESPIRRSVSVKATKEGVVRLPWSLAMISILSSRKIPTQEYVVPRSIPTKRMSQSAVVVSDGDEAVSELTDRWCHDGCEVGFGRRLEQSKQR